jgi:[ribosomal protein S5]-alanine N-acetyltransferase
VLAYPDPDLTDDPVRLRRWAAGDIGCVREASADDAIPEGTTVPAPFTEEAGLAFIARQLGRAERARGCRSPSPTLPPGSHEA